MEERIEQLMKSLDITREEALEIIQDDDDIDHDKPKEFDLTDEQLKVAKKMKNAPRTVKDAFGKTRQVRKTTDELKIGLVKAIAESLTDLSVDYVEISTDSKTKEDIKTEKVADIENLKIDNPTKIITFEFNGENYKIDLIRVRGKHKGK